MSSSGFIRIRRRLRQIWSQRLFDVNVTATVGMCNLVVPHMRLQGSGAIVNIESIGALVSLPWCSMYCASKFALRAYSRALRDERFCCRLRESINFDDADTAFDS